MLTSVSPFPRPHALGRLLSSTLPTARYFRSLLFVLLSLIGLVSLRVPISMIFSTVIPVRDFIQPYLMGRAILEGTDPYASIQDLANRYLGSLSANVFPHPTPYPPSVGLLLLPFSVLDYRVASMLWIAIEILCTAISVYLLARLFHMRLSPLFVIGITLALCAWVPFSAEFYWGQLGTLQLLLLVAFRLALQRERSGLCGLLLGLAILVKPTPWPLLILFLARRQFRLLAFCGATVILGFAAAGWIIGFNLLINYFTAVLPAVTLIYRANAGNASAWSIGWRLFDGTSSGLLTNSQGSTTAPPLLQSTSAAQVVSVLIPTLILVAGTFAAWKQKSIDVALGVMLCVSLLISPMLWNHYMVLLCLPLVWVAVWLYDHHFPVTLTNATLLVGLLLVTASDTFWAFIAILISLPSVVVTAKEIFLPTGPCLLTMEPAVAVAACALLLIKLGNTHLLRQP